MNCARDSRRPDRGEVGHAPLRDEAREPANKRKYTVIVVGTGLAGGSAAATLGELGYKVKCFCFQDSPRRAHSIAAQGGINAAKNYQNDGDSIYRLFYDTVKGGDFRSREANVYRLAQVSVNIIDQCVAQGVPFAREYGGLLANRSFGGAQVSRTFYARGQTGQQLLLGAYQALERQIGQGRRANVPAHRDARSRRHRWRARGDRDARPHHGRGRVARGRRGGPRQRRLRQRLLSLDEREGIERDGDLARVQARRGVRESVLHADPSDMHSRRAATISRSSRSCPSRCATTGACGCRSGRATRVRPIRFREDGARLFPRAGVSELRQPRRRATSPRARRSEVCDEGRGVGPNGARRLSGFRRRHRARRRSDDSRALREPLRDVQRITDENPYKVPMRIYPAVHYTMGGLWVDYNLMSTIPGLHVIGEANFSDHGANRLGASALMQGLADGYFIVTNTIGDYLATSEARAGGVDPCGVPRRGGAAWRRERSACSRRRDAHGGLLSPRAREHHVGVLRHVAQRRQG